MASEMTVPLKHSGHLQAQSSTGATSQSQEAEASTSRSRSRASSTSSRSSRSSNAIPTFEGLAPPRAPTTAPAEETLIPVAGIRRGQDNKGHVGTDPETGGGGGGGVKLKVDAGPGCGGIAWPAGEVLSRYIAYRHSVDRGFLKGKRILELGSGTGLVGLAAGLLEGSARVEVTDQEQLLDLMRANVALNYPDDPSPNVSVSELNWGEDLPEHIKVDELDMVLAADCVYFEPAFPLLVTTLIQLSPLPPHRPVPILFCWKKRRKADKRFFTMLKKHFDSEIVDDDGPGERERYMREGVTLLKLTRRRGGGDQ